jgi:hypothetical protein
MSSQSQQSRAAADPAAPALTNREEFVEKVTETGIDANTATAVHNLLVDESVLGNIKDADREFARLHAENVVKFVECMHPPAESRVQGRLRRAYRGDLDDGKQALDDATLANFRSILLGAFFRFSRSIDGWQQDKFGEQIQTRRIEDSRDEGGDGLLGGIFS